MRKMLMVIVCLIAAPAQASFNVDFQGTAPVGSDTQFNYLIRFLSNGSTEALVAGDFLTIYDFAGYVGPTPSNPAVVGITLGPNATAMSQFIGINAPFQVVPDNPLTENITVVYTGPTVTVDSDATLGIISSFSAIQEGFYSGQSTNNSDQIGTKLGNSGRTIVPAIPEPTSIVLLVMGALLVAVTVGRPIAARSIRL